VIVVVPAGRGRREMEKGRAKTGSVFLQKKRESPEWDPHVEQIGGEREGGGGGLPSGGSDKTARRRERVRGKIGEGWRFSSKSSVQRGRGKEVTWLVLTRGRGRKKKAGE